MTEGKLYKRNGSYYLLYDESEISGMEGCKTSLKYNENFLRMKRTGEVEGAYTVIEFNKGKRFSSIYQTPYGPIEMEVMTIDNFVLWPYWLSVALTQFVATWKLGADGGCLETDASKKMLELTDQYFDLLHHTQLPNLMPDISFIHVFVAYNHDHSPQRIEEIAKLKPSDSNKEIYYLAYASMLQSANRYPEAFSLLAKLA